MPKISCFSYCCEFSEIEKRDFIHHVFDQITFLRKSQPSDGIAGGKVLKKKLIFIDGQLS
jgi:hypothetical protein